MREYMDSFILSMPASPYLMSPLSSLYIATHAHPLEAVLLQTFASWHQSSCFLCGFTWQKEGQKGYSPWTHLSWCTPESSHRSSRTCSSSQQRQWRRRQGSV